MMSGRKTNMMRGVPSLVDLCVQVAVDNVRYLGNVGETDFHLLERILPHCTLDQLMHVEDCTEGRDLGPVTNELWNKFFERHFGARSVNLVVERMIEEKVKFSWRQLYEAQVKDMEDKEKMISVRVRDRYKMEESKKQSRQIRLCNKAPPSSSKRSFYGGTYSCISNTKSSIMKKAKLDFVKSNEVKNLVAMKNKTVQRTYSNEVKSLVAMKNKTGQGTYSNEVKNLVATKNKTVQGTYGASPANKSSGSASASRNTKPTGKRF